MNHRLSRITGCALLIALLSGCIHFDQSAIEEPVAPVRTLQQRDCCDSLLQMEVIELPAKKYLNIVIDEQDSVLEFRTGKSFAKAIQLPAINDEYLLQLDSVVYRPGIDLIPHALFPMVTLLDENLNAVAVFDREPLDYRRPLFGPSLLRITLTVEAGSAARYAIIHTSLARTNQGMATYAPFEIVQHRPFDSLLYARPSNSAQKIHFAETGMINLLAYPLR